MQRIYMTWHIQINRARILTRVKTQPILMIEEFSQQEVDENILCFLPTVKHQLWPCEANMELLQARHCEADSDGRWEVHHDTVFCADILWTGCIWHCQQLGVSSGPFPVPANRGISILLLLTDGGKRYSNTRTEPGAAISSCWCYLHFFHLILWYLYFLWY